MKTIEEKRTALLAECATLCPKEGDKINILGDVALISNCGDSIWKLDWKYMDGKIWMCDTLPDWLVDVVYRILGLAERDAVAAYKASLQSDLKSMTSIVSSVKKGEQPDYVHVSKLEALEAKNATLEKRLDVAINDLRKKCDFSGRLVEENTAMEKRNAALVAAAELVIKRNWERINGDGSDYSLFSQAIGNLGDALAANEKGGVQG